MTLGLAATIQFITDASCIIGENAEVYYVNDRRKLCIEYVDTSICVRMKLSYASMRNN